MDNKTEIIRLRKEGNGYGAIAKELNLSKDYVSKVCSRNKSIIEGTDSICKCCGKTFIATARVGRPQKFCSSKCRSKWWNKNQTKLSTYEKYKHKCECCGKEFISVGRTNAKYCSLDCYRNKGDNNE